MYDIANAEIARQIGMSRATVSYWRSHPEKIPDSGIKLLESFGYSRYF